MAKFIPRRISAEMAALGYNNEGQGTLIGYIAIPRLHEATCPYRKNPDRAICACRIGLWQRVKPRVRVKARSVAFSRQEQ